MVGLCQVPKIMYTISYAFNIALLIVIIVKDYLSGFMSTVIREIFKVKKFSWVALTHEN